MDKMLLKINIIGNLKKINFLNFIKKFYISSKTFKLEIINTKSKSSSDKDVKIEIKNLGIKTDIFIIFFINN